jgi:hypothetical protein
MAPCEKFPERKLKRNDDLLLLLLLLQLLQR